MLRTSGPPACDETCQHRGYFASDPGTGLFYDDRSSSRHCDRELAKREAIQESKAKVWIASQARNDCPDMDGDTSLGQFTHHGSRRRGAFPVSPLARSSSREISPQPEIRPRRPNRDDGPRRARNLLWKPPIRATERGIFRARISVSRNSGSFSGCRSSSIMSMGAAMSMRCGHSMKSANSSAAGKRRMMQGQTMLGLFDERERWSPSLRSRCCDGSPAMRPRLPHCVRNDARSGKQSSGAKRRSGLLRKLAMTGAALRVQS